MQCRPLIQNRGVKMFQCSGIEGFCSKISSGGSLENSLPAGVCPYARLSKHFRLWSANGGADRDGLIFVRCTVTTERRWCRFQTNLSHVARAMCDCANTCKEVVARGAGQTNERIWLKLDGLIATMGGLNPFGQARKAPPSLVREARE